MTIPFPSICEVAQFINLWITDSLSWFRYSGSIARDRLSRKWFIKEGLTGECGKEVGEIGQTGECTQQEWNVRQSSLRISLKETQDCNLSLRVALILGRELELSCSELINHWLTTFPEACTFPGCELSLWVKWAPITREQFPPKITDTGYWKQEHTKQESGSSHTKWLNRMQGDRSGTLF